MSSILPEVHGNVPANGGSLYTVTIADIAKAFYVTGGFIGGVTMTDQASGFGRGFDVYDDQFTFSFEDMSRDGAEVTQRTADWIAKQQVNILLIILMLTFLIRRRKTCMILTMMVRLTAPMRSRPYRDGQKTPSARDVQHWRSMMLRSQSWIRRLLHC